MGSNLTLQMMDDTPAQYNSENTEGNIFGKNFIKDDFEKTCIAVEDHISKNEWKIALKKIIDFEKNKKKIEIEQQKVKKIFSFFKTKWRNLSFYGFLRRKTISI